MGLLYIFPTEKHEGDRIQITSNEAILKTYGLPYIFWFYAGGILLILSLLFLAIYGPLSKLASYGTGLDQIILTAVGALFILCPLILAGFFFYEKQIKVMGNKIIITHKIFYIALKSNEYTLHPQEKFEIRHYLESPNMARLSGQKDLRGFQNKGYFELYFKDENNKLTFLDRHSRKSDLQKIKKMLELTNN